MNDVAQMLLNLIFNLCISEVKITVWMNKPIKVLLSVIIEKKRKEKKENDFLVPIIDIEEIHLTVKLITKRDYVQ